MAQYFKKKMQTSDGSSRYYYVQVNMDGSKRIISKATYTNQKKGGGDGPLYLTGAMYYNYIKVGDNMEVFILGERHDAANCENKPQLALPAMVNNHPFSKPVMLYEYDPRHSIFGSKFTIHKYVNELLPKIPSEYIWRYGKGPQEILGVLNDEQTYQLLHPGVWIDRYRLVNLIKENVRTIEDLRKFIKSFILPQETICSWYAEFVIKVGAHRDSTLNLQENTYKDLLRGMTVNIQNSISNYIDYIINDRIFTEFYSTMQDGSSNQEHWTVVLSIFFDVRAILQILTILNREQGKAVSIFYLCGASHAYNASLYLNRYMSIKSQFCMTDENEFVDLDKQQPFDEETVTKEMMAFYDKLKKPRAGGELHRRRLGRTKR